MPTYSVTAEDGWTDANLDLNLYPSEPETERNQKVATKSIKRVRMAENFNSVEASANTTVYEPISNRSGISLIKAYY